MTTQQINISAQDQEKLQKALNIKNVQAQKEYLAKQYGDRVEIDDRFVSQLENSRGSKTTIAVAVSAHTNVDGAVMRPIRIIDTNGSQIVGDTGFYIPAGYKNIEDVQKAEFNIPPVVQEVKKERETGDPLERPVMASPDMTPEQERQLAARVALERRERALRAAEKDLNDRYGNMVGLAITQPPAPGEEATVAAPGAPGSPACAKPAVVEGHEWLGFTPITAEELLK